MTINSIKEFLENRKKVLLEELSLISSNFEEMNLNNGNFDYPFFDSFDEIVASLSIENDYEDIKEIHSTIIQRLEEASKTEEIVQVFQNDEEDLEAVLKLDIVEEATLENFNGFGIGVLKDGRPFCFGRANGELEIEVYKDVQSLENGTEADEFIKVKD